MRRARDTRLARLAAPAARVGSAEALDRCALRARVRACALVRDALTQAGIDPARATALHLAPHPDSLPAIPGSSPGRAREQLDEFAASDDDGLARSFAAKIGDIARRYEDGHEPDFGKASLAELLAWSLTRPAHTPGQPVEAPA